MKDILLLTKQLNQLRLSKPELTIGEFKAEVKKFVGYNTFPYLLIEEGCAYSINGKIHFSSNPIHHSKVRQIMEDVREQQYKYNESCKKKKVEQSLKLSEAIEYLKSQGYIIIKPEKTL